LQSLEFGGIENYSRCCLNYVRRLTTLETSAHQLTPVKVVSLLLASAIPVGVLFSWLWQEWLLFAAVASVLLLLSGGLLFSSKNPIVHATVLGVATGAFVGSLVGISGLISH
jgi:hypothetical protein